MADEQEPECKTILDLVLYKIDRTLAVCGVIAIAMFALWVCKALDGMNIATTAIGGLVGYIGGRSK